MAVIMDPIDEAEIPSSPNNEIEDEEQLNLEEYLAEIIDQLETILAEDAANTNLEEVPAVTDSQSPQTPDENNGIWNLNEDLDTNFDDVTKSSLSPIAGEVTPSAQVENANPGKFNYELFGVQHTSTLNPEAPEFVSTAHQQDLGSANYSWGICTAAESTLNPLAAEFFPGMPYQGLNSTNFDLDSIDVDDLLQ